MPEPEPQQNLCTGLADGTPCGSGVISECRGADVCRAGACVAVFAHAGTVCGDVLPSGVCDQPDACDGAGTCAKNHAPDGTACGDVRDSTCDGADTCVSGECASNIAVAGSPCGDVTETTCTAPDTCDGVGHCLDNHTADGTACGDSADTFCNPADTCLAGACQVVLTDTGTACGDQTSTTCDLPDTCDDVGTCAVNYVASGTACGDDTTNQCNGADLCDGAGACATHVVADGTVCYDCVAGVGACDVCAASVCDNRDQAVCVGASAIDASNTAGNNHRGNMFDIVATNTVTIRSFDASPMGNTTVEIYYKIGTWNGFANTPTAWTYVGSAATSYTGGFSAVAVPVNVTIPAGQTYAFYVTSNTSAVSMNYSNGTNVGNVYSSDANLTFLEGGGLEYPFTANTGAVYQPRVWNGRIHYDVPTALDTAPGSYEGATAGGVMFDVEALGKTSLDDLAAELVSGIAEAKVYFRRGTFAGHESSAAGWEPIATILASDVDSAGGGARSRFFFDDTIELDSGEVVGIYIDSTQADQLRTVSGGAVGDVVATDGELTVYVGSAVTSSFGGAGSAATVRATVNSAPCAIAP